MTRTHGRPPGEVMGPPAGSTHSRGRAALVDLALLLAFAVLWPGAVILTLAVARWTSYGPVVMKLSHSHGVHAGDAVAGLICFVVAATITVALLRWARRARG